MVGESTEVEGEKDRKKRKSRGRGRKSQIINRFRLSASTIGMDISRCLAKCLPLLDKAGLHCQYKPLWFII